MNYITAEQARNIALENFTKVYTGNARNIIDEYIMPKIKESSLDGRTSLRFYRLMKIEDKDNIVEALILMGYDAKNEYPNVGRHYMIIKW